MLDSFPYGASNPNSSKPRAILGLPNAAANVTLEINLLLSYCEGDYYLNEFASATRNGDYLLPTSCAERG